MSSSDRGEFDLRRDLPTSAEDVRALRRARPAAMTLQEYLEFLARLPHPPAGELRRRPLHLGEPFQLPD